MGTFVTMEGGDSEFAKSTMPTLKGIFKGPWSECVGQQARTCCSCYRMPKNAFFLRPRDLLIRSETMQRHFFLLILHHLSPEVLANATVMAFVLRRNSRFNFYCYKQREPTLYQVINVCSLIKGITPKICMSCFVLIGSVVLLNVLGCRLTY